MRITSVVFIGFLFFGCSTLGEPKVENEIQGFNEFLGTEKANALNAAVESFEHFLVANYSNLDNHEARTKTFLEHIARHNEPDPSWTLATDKNLKIIEAFESTGLRKEIWLYGHEEYTPRNKIHELVVPEQRDTSIMTYLGELDLEFIDDEISTITSVDSVEIANRDMEFKEKIRNSLHSNGSGYFLYGLAKFASKDSLIQEYVKVKVNENNISPGVIAGGFLESTMSFDDPFIKRMLVVEFYYWIMKWDIDRD